MFALGTILYELLTRKPAVAGEGPLQILYQVVHGEIAPLSQHLPRVSRDLEAICHKALEKKAINRYSSAGEFAADIECFLNGQAIAADRLSGRYRIRQGIKKYRWPVAIITGCLLLPILVFFFFKYYQQLARHHQSAGYLDEVKEILAREQLSIESYSKAADILTKAWILSGDKAVQQQLYTTYRQIGFLAMAEENFLLARIAFSRCEKIDAHRENFGEILQQTRLQREKRQLKRLQEIMVELMEEEKPDKEGDDWYTTEITRMSGPHMVKKLLQYLNSPYPRQRLIAIRALGKLGDITTQVKGKDSVEWLLQVLKNTHPQQNPEQAEAVVWALGWLRDPRAADAVYEIRRQAGQRSIFWRKTQIPYSWIPLRQEILSVDWQKFNQRGWLKLERGELQGALADFNRAIELYQAADNYNGRGNVYLEQGEVDKAIADFTTAIAIDPDIAEAYNNRGMIRRNKRDIAGALADFSKAITLVPDFAHFYNGRGTVFIVAKNYESAIEDFNCALQLLPSYDLAYYNRALAWRAKAQPERAFSDLYMALELNPRNVDALYLQGTIHFEQGNFKAALVVLTQAIALNPSRPLSYYKRALIKEAIGDIQAAIADYDIVLRLDSQDVESYNNRGLLWEATGDFARAIADYDQAIALAPEIAELYYNRGNARFKSANVVGAIVDYDKAIELNPNLPQVANNRTLAHEYMQKQEVE